MLSSGVPPAGCNRVFATIHWSLVATAADPTSPQAAEALEQLCRTYWYPLYAFVRRYGCSPEDAQDLTQAFFERLLGKNLIAVADPHRGRFRTFLLTALKNFLISQHEHQNAAKRGGGVRILPLSPADPETRYRAEPADPATPDLLYERPGLSPSSKTPWADSAANTPRPDVARGSTNSRISSEARRTTSPTSR